MIYIRMNSASSGRMPQLGLDLYNTRAVRGATLPGKAGLVYPSISLLVNLCPP